MISIQTQLAAVLAEKLNQVSAEIPLQPIRVFDIGIFPWHTSTELSFLCIGDTVDEEDIAT